MKNRIFLLLFIVTFNILEVSAKTRKKSLASYFNYISEFECKTIESLIKSKDTNHLALFMAFDSTMDGKKLRMNEKYLNAISNRILKNKHKFKNEYYYLEFVFSFIQEYYLKYYIPDVTFQNLIYKRKYNCVSATAFYALILKNIGIKYRIFETSDHVYLKVYSNNEEYLFETTDKNGFIVKKDEILKTEIQYAKNTDSLSSKIFLQYDKNPENNLIKEINLTQLAGIQYFNISALFLEKNDYITAYDFAEKAYMLYPSARTYNAMMYILSKLIVCNKISYQEKLQYYRKQKMLTSVITAWG